MAEYPVMPLQPDEVLEEEEFERLYSAPAEIVALLSIFYGGISILAVIGNTLVIWVVATTRQMRTVTNMYIANLAFADVIIGLFCIPFQFQAALLQSWNLPWFMCGFCPFIQALSVNVSVFTLTAIAIDRHRAIINPLRARPTKFISKIIIGSIWLVALTFAIPCAIAFRVELVHERFKENDEIFNVTRPFCMNKNLSEPQLQTYRYSLVFVQYLVPFCVISFVYIQMAVKLWGTRAPGNAQDSRDITLLKNKKKVIKMLIIVVVVFGLCWLPLQLYNILYVTIPEINEYHFISIIWFSCDWLAMSNSCYNPFIYGIYNEKFKREFNKRFTTCFCKFQTSLDAHERTVSVHTRASSVRSTYANSSMRVRKNLFLSGGGGPAHLTHNGHAHGLRSKRAEAKNGGQNNVYNVIAYANGSNGTSAGLTNGNGHDKGLGYGHGQGLGCNNGQGLGYNNGQFPVYGNGQGPGCGNGVFAPNNNQSQWRRNHFRPLHPNVIEHEDDDDDGNVAVTFVELRLTPPIEEGSNEPHSLTEEAAPSSTSPADSSGCICEQELGSSNDCDGTCILNEVSRVQVPIETSTKGPTNNNNNNNNNECKAGFNYRDSAELELNEFSPLNATEAGAPRTTTMA